MKKAFLYILSALCITFVSCDKVSVIDTTEYAPEVTSFTPMSAPVGAEIVVTGKNLHNVVRAYIGEAPVTICQKVSDKRLSIRVTEDVTSGTIRLENTVGVGESADVFTVSFAVPSVNAGILQSSAVMGGEMMIAGESLNSVIDVLFTAEGFETAHTATIISRSDEEIIVRVPYVESSNAAITLTYNNGSEVVATELASAPKLEIIRYVPVFDTYTYERTAVGRSITLTGEHLDKVDRILVGEFAANMSKQEKSLTFTIPAGDFADGETQTTIVAEYFDGNETIVLSPNFTVYVPFVKYWENITVSSHGKTGLNQCFFSPETGLVYANADWRTTLDPISFQYLGNTCSAAQTPSVTVEEYNSVNPYFFFYINNQNAIAINSPANSASLLKNFWIGNLSGDANRLPGANGNCYGTPVMAYRYLNEANATEKAIIDAVHAGAIENIDETLYPIDATALTIAGVSVASLSGANSDWSKGVISDLTKDAVYNIDKVVMVLYFDHAGFNKDAVDNLKHIKRIGFVNVKKIDYKVDPTNSSHAALLSEITFNCYWQKYDYDFSKLN